MFRAPDIKKEKQAEILNRIRKIAPFYLKDIDMSSAKGSNAAMFQIVTNMMDMIIRRLNQVPDKNLVAFLDMMSVKLLPPQSAKAPVTFVLSEGAKNNVIVSEKKQLLAGEVIFETDKTFVVTPAKLVKGYSVDFKNDKVYEVPADISIDKKIEPFVHDKVYEVPADILVGKKIEPFRTRLLYDADSTNILFVENATGLKKKDTIKIYSEDKKNRSASKYYHYSIIEVTGNKITLDRKITDTAPKEVMVEKVTDFDFFERNDLQQHILYFGDGSLFNIKSSNSIISIKNGDIKGKWEYYGVLNQITGWHSLINADKINVSGAKMNGEIVETSVNGNKNKWIRCISEQEDIQFKNLRFSVNAEKIQADAAFNNDVPLDINKSFYPLGNIPKLHDTFYISSQECFSKKGAKVTINLNGNLDQWSQMTPTKPDPKAQLSWEYWDGQNWAKLSVTGNVNLLAITDKNPAINDKLIIDCLPEIKPAKINGVENLWIRARLISGHYGLESYVGEQKQETTKVTIQYSKNGSSENTTVTVPQVTVSSIQKGTVTPPVITSISLSYHNKGNSQFCENYIVYSNLEYRDITIECRDENKNIRPFEVFDGSGTHFYIAFDRRPEKGPIPIFFDLDISMQGNEQSNIRWEYCSDISGGKEKWERLEVLDNTKGFTQSDTIEFVFHNICKTKRFGQELYWIRAIGLDNKVLKSRIRGIHINTAWVSQIQTLKDVVLGSSDGSKEQSYKFPNKPVLSAEVWINEISRLSNNEMEQLKKDYVHEPVEIKDKDGNVIEFWLKWQESDNLYTLEAGSRGYEIDKSAGTIRFGDGIYGNIPPIGKNNIKVNYRLGGGLNGNVAEKGINALKSSIAFVDKVFNPLPAGGGSDIEVLESAVDRGAHIIKNRNRVITAEDYEYMVLEMSSGIARVKSIPDSISFAGEVKTKPGGVVVVIIPSSSEDNPCPSIQMVSQVKNYLANFAPATADIYVLPPRYWLVNIDMVITSIAPEYIPSIEKDSLEELKTFLHPLKGGYDGKGWEFGRIPYLSDIYSLIEKIVGVDYIDSLKITLKTEDGKEQITISENSELIYLRDHEIICNGTHSITASFKQEASA